MDDISLSPAGSMQGAHPGGGGDTSTGSGLEQELEVTQAGKWELKKFTQRHKDICALIAQGLKRKQIADICGVTPEYVTMLARQPKCIQFIQEMNQYAAVQLDAMFVKTVDVINDAMDNGSTEERLRAARLQLEVTKRIGRPDPSAGQVAGTDDRLLNLAERLTGLLAKARGVSDGEEITDAEFREVPQQVSQGEEG